MAETIKTDVLVVGGGGAGARAALEANRHGARVVLAVKGHFGAVGTRGSGGTCPALSEAGGMRAAGATGAQGLAPETVEEGYANVIQLGLGMVDPKLARILVEEAYMQRKVLEGYGVYFRFGLGWGARAHGVPLVGGLEGHIRHSSIDVRDGLMITNLLTRNSEVVGAVGVDENTGNVVIIRAGAVILATGGNGQLFLHSFNPSCVTGDGYAMGYEAGGELMNMEYMQMFIGTVYPTRNITHTWGWRHRAKLLNANGEEFVAKYCPPGVTVDMVMDEHYRHNPITTRDPYSRYLDIAIIEEVKAGRGTPHAGVWMDFRGQEHLMEPSLSDWFRYRGVFFNNELVEINVCHHCSDGGFRVNEFAQTSLPRLYGVGECLTGPHGADRRGGNMLAATQVFGTRAAIHAANATKGKTLPDIDAKQASDFEQHLVALSQKKGSLRPQAIKRTLQKKAWEDLLFIRSEQSLKSAQAEVGRIRGELLPQLSVEGPMDLVEAVELENMLTVADILTNAALMRKESRGPHFRRDYPQRDDANWLKTITVKKVNGQMQLGTTVVDPNWKWREGDMGPGIWG